MAVDAVADREQRKEQGEQAHVRVYVRTEGRGPALERLANGGRVGCRG
jgi:hypothetical protein